MKVGGFVFLQCDEAVVGCVVATVYFLHESGHNLEFVLVVLRSGERHGAVSTLTLISLSSTMRTWATACLLDGRGVELLDPPGELTAWFGYSDVPLSSRSEFQSELLSIFVCGDMGGKSASGAGDAGCIWISRHFIIFSTAL